MGDCLFKQAIAIGFIPANNAKSVPCYPCTVIRFYIFEKVDLKSKNLD
jgi:hypothetical protein